jgi:Type III secretion system lipoprotein chaperone (YscW)
MFFASGDAVSATLHAFGKSSELPAVDAIKGVRYGNRDITLWIKDDTAAVQRNDKIEFRDCVLARPAPAGEHSVEALTSPLDLSHRWRAITGTAIYHERIALHPTAVLVVRLEEISWQDVPPQGATLFRHYAAQNIYVSRATS